MITVDFSYQPAGLSVQFNNQIVENFDSLSWDFGDGSAPSTEDNPVHLFSKAGYYLVTLEVTLGSEIATQSHQISVVTNGIGFPYSIAQYIGFVIPSDIEVNTTYRDILITKWQLQFGPSIILDGDYYNQLKYPALYNQLIGDLVIYDLVVAGANNYLISVGQGENSSQGGKQVKRIASGPAEAEWFSGSDVWSKIMTTGGLFEMLQENICSTAKHLKVHIPFCKPFQITIPPKVYKLPTHRDHPYNLIRNL